MSETNHKLLVANRGEIAIRILRAASELNIPTVAIFTYEDRFSLHRYKADEAYQIGAEDDPLKPYLDIEEIIDLAKRKGATLIHPGYGFLSENVNLARRCAEEGIIFVGPRPEVMAKLGDKVAAKMIAIEAQVPVIQDNTEDLTSSEIAKKEAHRIGYPIMLKAAAGGGGRGMRVVRDEKQLENAFHEAKKEAANAFGDDTMFMEKYIDNPKHIEVQIMGDNYGNLVHLFERDCSVQRRFQKVVEVAPSFLPQETKDKIYDYALKITRHVNYNNVGTVEFLVDAENNIYFIEVNPRVQVEHTITEEITGVDIVRTQILIAQGKPLHDKGIYLRSQADVKANGFAIQCRVTTENPADGFKPDYGTIIAYRSGGGFGIRLDAGSCYEGMRISPFFDSLLVKVSAKGRTLRGAAERLHRSLREFRVRGVNTNIGFLLNVISHETFIKGKATVKFIDENPNLLTVSDSQDRATKALRYLGEIIVNGNPDVKFVDEKKEFRTPYVPDYNRFEPYPEGTKHQLTTLGRAKFVEWLKNQTAIQYTDTTFRDGHQSLLATRVRTIDMLKVAESFARHHPNTFSMEVWGGATFDVAMRFLKESPWERLRKIRQAVPNILLQMLLRGSNAVGYTAYPDNLVEKFIEEAAKNGIDIFRIFDSLNWLESMKTAIKAVRERTDSLAEVAIGYTGEIRDPNNTKYTLQYYLDMARQIEDAGANILAIKDMAGLLKPYSAELLITELKKAVDLPIHLHTHDTAGIQSATYLKAIEAGVDVIDVALGAMSGLTSQPSYNSMVALMQGHQRELPVNLMVLNQFSNYWEDVREYYYPFESGLKAGTAQVYEHEIPGGQYTNLRPQAIGLGLDDKFELIKKNYAEANQFFGNIVKVTPSSKVVGDLAMFMTANGLTRQDLVNRGQSLSFPESVIGMLKGHLGKPAGGFPEESMQAVLGDERPTFELKGRQLPPVDFDAEFTDFKNKFGKKLEMTDFLSYKLYPKVYEDFYEAQEKYGDLSVLPTLAFFYGLKPQEDVLIQIGEGKILTIKLLYFSKPDENGMRTISFELNGQARRIEVKDKNYKVNKVQNRKASTENEVGAPLQGRISAVSVEIGQEIEANTPLFVIEAMKMESTITATKAGKIKEIILKKGAMVEQGDLILTIESI